jgi:protein adenylyltransferase
VPIAETSVNVAADDTVRRLFKDPLAFDSWAVKWRERLSVEGGTSAQRCEAMRRVNPKYIPRNHRMEQALDAAVQRADWVPLERLLAVLAAPFDEQPENAIYALPPLPEEVVQQTFCGT